MHHMCTHMICIYSAQVLFCHWKEFSKYILNRFRSLGFSCDLPRLFLDIFENYSSKPRLSWLLWKGWCTLNPPNLLPVLAFLWCVPALFWSEAISPRSNFTLQTGTTWCQHSWCSLVDRPTRLTRIFMIVFVSLCLCFMTNIKVSNIIQAHKAR